MACSGVIRVGDEKVSLQFSIIDCLIDGTTEQLDITGATDITIRFQRQNGVESEVVGTIYTGGTNGNGTDGLVEYITPAGFFTEVDIGTLKGIAIVTFSDTGPYHSSPGKFKIKANF